MFQVKNNLSCEIMKQVFDFQEPKHNFPSKIMQLRREDIKMIHYVIQSIRFLAPKTRAMIPQKNKN